jgi:type I site-specific restriction endonuclease
LNSSSIRTLREKLFTEIFPGRTEVPKTLIFAKDDSHADDIVQIVREEFAKGNDLLPFSLGDKSNLEFNQSMPPEQSITQKECWTSFV